MFDYTGTADTAYQLVAEFGQDVTITRKGDDATFDPVEGEYTDNGTPIVNTAKALRIKVNPGLLGNQDNKLLTELVRGKVTGLLIAAKGLTITLVNNDVVQLADGTIWTLLGATPLNPAGTPILFKALLRQK